jgi:hypothetical protein
LGQDVAGDEVAFRQMRVARQDEGVDARITYLAKFARHLIGVTDDGDARPTAGATDTGPEMSLDVAIGVG